MIDKNTLIYYFLTIRAKVKNILNMLLVYFFSIKNVTVINTKSKLINITGRYYLIQLLKNIVLYINKFIDLIDVECNTVQIVKRTNSRDVKYIKNVQCIKNIDDVYTNIIIKPFSSKNIITKLELHDNDQKKCLKNIINLYSESKTHTIDNIFIFNNIDFSNNASLFIQYFKKGKMIKNTYSIDEVKNRPIGFIYE